MSLRKGNKMTKKERIEKYIWLLNQYCFSGDTEYDHSMSDSLLEDLLTELGYEEVVSVYKNVEKWYV